MARRGGRAGSALISEAFKFLRKAKRRNRPGRMSPWAREHVFRGHVKPGAPKGSGYHYRPGGQDFPGRRIKPGSRVDHPTNGVYEAKPEFFDPTVNPPHGGWKPKAGNGGQSSFYPDHWSPAEVDAAPAEAFKNAVPTSGNMWRGTYRGIVIEGYYDSAGGLKHGWPVLNP